MTPDEIKAAAGNLNDLERIPQIVKDIEAGAPITITVGASNLNIHPLQAPEIREALTAYLSGISAKARAQLADLGIDQTALMKRLLSLTPKPSRTDSPIERPYSRRV